MQVAGAMLAAMDPQRAGQPWTVYTQPASVRPSLNLFDTELMVHIHACAHQKKNTD
jgi:hypothetical protein